MRATANVSNLISRSGSKRSIAPIRPSRPYEIRSASSMCAGRPLDIRPGDELHQRRVGEHELLASLLVAALLVAGPELLEVDFADVSCPYGRGVGPTPAGGSAVLAAQPALTLPECRSGSSRRWRGPAAPGSRAGRRRPRAGGWQTNGAAHAGTRRPASPRCAARRAAGAARPRATGAGRSWTGTGPARARSCGERRAARGQIALERPLGRLADRHHAGLGPLAEHASAPRRRSRRSPTSRFTTSSQRSPHE